MAVWAKVFGNIVGTGCVRHLAHGRFTALRRQCTCRALSTFHNQMMRRLRVNKLELELEFCVGREKFLSLQHKRRAYDRAK